MINEKALRKYSHVNLKDHLDIYSPHNEDEFNCVLNECRRKIVLATVYKYYDAKAHEIFQEEYGPFSQEEDDDMDLEKYNDTFDEWMCGRNIKGETIKFLMKNKMKILLKRIDGPDYRVDLSIRERK